MKTRHYLKQIKQKQNDVFNTCFFVFHCSGLTSHQLRHLKNLFYIETNGFYKTRHKSGSLCYLSLQSHTKPQVVIEHSNLDKFDLLSKRICDLFVAISNKSQNDPQNKLRSDLFFKQVENNVNLSRLLTKVNSKEGIHMLLLYGKANSNLLSHVDIKRSPGWSMPFGPSIELNSQLILNSFFQSCMQDVQTLTYCLSSYKIQNSLQSVVLSKSSK